MSDARSSDLPRLAARRPDAHKGDFGKLLVVGGSVGLTGAACLAASSALRSGAGLVTVAAPERAAGIVTTVQPCAMTLPLAQTETGGVSVRAAPAILEFLERADALVLGPGLGLSPDSVTLVERLLRALPCPAVVDADGLNALARQTALLDRCPRPIVLTPHPGEMRRLDDAAAEGMAKDRAAYARTFARRFDGVLVLKGKETVVSDGERSYRNCTGNPGLATGGTGDVLSGVLGALLGQGLDAFDAAVLAVYLHGRAGDLAAERRGEIGMIASDVVDALPRAFLEHHEDAETAP